jgi:hypothetical protein
MLRINPGERNTDMEQGPCASYTDALDRIRTLVSAERAVTDLRHYLTSYGGRRFDELADRSKPCEFTVNDFEAVGKLNVSVLLSARDWLIGDGRDEVRALLCQIPADLDIWDVEPEEYQAILGQESPAWKLWEILYHLQEGARHAGRGVTAGKLLHGKRPRLIPIFDRARVAQTIGVAHLHFWEAIWCALRDSGIRDGLRAVQAEVTEASGLSLLRVLDIIIWMSTEPPGN